MLIEEVRVKKQLLTPRYESNKARNGIGIFASSSGVVWSVALESLTFSVVPDKNNNIFESTTDSKNMRLNRCYDFYGCKPQEQTHYRLTWLELR